MTKIELIRHIAEQMEKPQTEIKRLYDCTIDAFRLKLGNGIGISIPGFGVFSTNLKSKHIAYNPALKQKMMVPPKNVLVFKPSSVLKVKLKFKRLEDGR